MMGATASSSKGAADVQSDCIADLVLVVLSLREEQELLKLCRKVGYQLEVESVHFRFYPCRYYKY